MSGFIGWLAPHDALFGIAPYKLYVGRAASRAVGGRYSRFRRLAWTKTESLSSPASIHVFYFTPTFACLSSVFISLAFLCFCCVQACCCRLFWLAVALLCYLGAAQPLSETSSAELLVSSRFPPSSSWLLRHPAGRHPLPLIPLLLSKLSMTASPVVSKCHCVI